VYVLLEATQVNWEPPYALCVLIVNILLLALHPVATHLLPVHQAHMPLGPTAALLVRQELLRVRWVPPLPPHARFVLLEHILLNRGRLAALHALQEAPPVR
jgi:hypothetical protein